MKYEKTIKEEFAKLVTENKELEMGKKIEAEHKNTVQKIRNSVQNNQITMSDEEIFESIAKDHLSELSDYYTRLQAMEKAAES